MAACKEIQQRYDWKAKQINHFLAQGELLEEPKPKTTTFRLSENVLDWRKQLQNARSNRSKLKNKIELHSEDHPKQPLWAKKLKQIKKDIEEIESNITAHE